MDNKIIDSKSVFFFKNIADSEIENILKNSRFNITTFKKGDVIYSPEEYKKEVGFVLDGECTVNKRRSDGSFVCLNILKKNESFGILTVFTKEDFPTYVIAKKNCTVAFISENNVKELVQANNKIAYNVIEFLADRITFLNRRISTYSSGNCEEKLASYLLGRVKESGVFELDFNKKRGAEIIGCGRASLYRAISYLVECGAIISDDKKIIIKNISLLERISK